MTDRRLQVRLDPDTHRALRLEAARLDVSIQDLVEGWLREKLGLAPKPEPKPDRGRKGGAVYPTGGLPASLTCDRSG